MEKNNPQEDTREDFEWVFSSSPKIKNSRAERSACQHWERCHRQNVVTVDEMELDIKKLKKISHANDEWVWCWCWCYDVSEGFVLTEMNFDLISSNAYENVCDYRKWYCVQLKSKSEYQSDVTPRIYLSLSWSLYFKIIIGIFNDFCIYTETFIVQWYIYVCASSPPPFSMHFAWMR